MVHKLASFGVSSRQCRQGVLTWQIPRCFLNAYVNEKGGSCTGVLLAKSLRLEMDLEWEGAFGG